MQKLTVLIIAVSAFLSTLSCDKLNTENNQSSTNSSTANGSSDDEFEAYFQSSINTLNFCGDDLMESINALTTESPRYEPLGELVKEVDGYLTNARDLGESLYLELEENSVQQVMIEDQGAQNLLEVLQDTKENLMTPLFRMTENSQQLGNLDEQELKKFQNTLPLLNPRLWADNDQPAQFDGLSVDAAKRKLLKIQQNISQTRALYYRFLNQQIGKKQISYDKFDVLASSEKAYILLGESYTAQIALGAYSSQSKFSVSVNGRSLPIKDGKATYTARPSRVGEQKYSARISVNNPLTGETETFTKDFYFEVGQPSVTVSADNMNILLIGEDNPVTIAAAGISSNNVAVSISGGGSTIKRLGKTQFMVKPVMAGKVIIVVKNKENGKSFPFTFEAKEK